MPTEDKLPLVSIVAVCYNHERYVKETLDSILAQTYPNTQLIIMDDCSQDHSVEVIEGWIDRNGGDCAFVAHKENQGLCRTLNEAISQYCVGKYLQIIACDDVLEEQKLKVQVDLLENLPDEYAVTCSNFEEIDENSQSRGIYFKEDFQFPDDVFSAILSGWMGYKIIVHSPTVLVRSSVFNEVGQYDERIIQEDLDMWLRVSLHKKIHFSPLPLVKYRVLQTSLSRHHAHRAKILEGRLAVVEKLEQTPDLERGRLTALGNHKIGLLHQLVVLYLNKGINDPSIYTSLLEKFSRGVLKNHFFESSLSTNIRSALMNIYCHKNGRGLVAQIVQKLSFKESYHSLALIFFMRLGMPPVTLRKLVNYKQAVRRRLAKLTVN